jgi:hypothetical protein
MAGFQGLVPHDLRGGGVSLLRVYYTTGFVMLPWPLGPGVCLDPDGCKNFSPLLVVLLNS